MQQKKILSGCSERIICEIPFKMPNLNDYIKVCRGNKFAAASMKSGVENEIYYFIRSLPKIEYPVWIDFIWCEKDARRDLDNIAFAKKFILDALVKFGKLKDDGQAFVKGFSDRVEKSEDYKVILIIKEYKDERFKGSAVGETARGNTASDD